MKFRSLLCLLLALASAGLLLPAGARAADAEKTAAAADAAPPQMLFVIEMHLTTDPNAEFTPEQGEALVGHIGHLAELYEQGALLMAGPFDDDSGAGISIVVASSLEEARSYEESDPAVTNGMLSIDGVHPWWDAFNRYEGRHLTREEFMQMMQAPPEPASADGAAAEAH